jgi:hypothetical protein
VTYLTRLALFSTLFAGMALAVSAARAAEDDLRISVRAGCLDEANCCFGKWKVKSDADVFQTDDGIDKTGTVKAGQEVEGMSGRVHSDPGKVKIVYIHHPWKKGQTVGLYSEPDENGKARVGTADQSELEAASFLKPGAAKCEKPSKDCWGLVLSRPKVKWWIQVKLPAEKSDGDKPADEKTGWVQSTHIAVDTECRL